MIFLVVRVDENVINEYYDERVKVFMKDPVHEIHYSRRYICDTK